MRRLALAALLALVPAAASAQGSFSFIDGELAYTSTFTAVGTFACGGALRPGDSCAASGNTLTLGHAGSFTTFTYTPLAAQTLTITPRAELVTLGTITKTYSGAGPYEFPAPPLRLQRATFTFRVAINGRATGFDYAPRGGTETVRGCCENSPEPSIVLPLPGQPAGYTYAASFDFSAPRLTRVTTGAEPDAIRAYTSLVPEPGTWALVGAGLLAVGAVARRRTA